MGEHPGAAALAVIAFVLGLVLLIAGVRGTYLDVWEALKAGPPKSQGGGGGGGGGGGNTKVR